MAINMPIQGTAADGMKIAMVRVDAAHPRRAGSARGCCSRSTTSSCSRPTRRSCRARRARDGASWRPRCPSTCRSRSTSRSGRTGSRWTDTCAATAALAARAEDGRRGGPGRGRGGGRRRARSVARCRSCPRSRRSRAIFSAGSRAPRSRDATVHWDRTIRHPQPPERFVAEISGADDPARRPAGEDGPAPPRGRPRDDRGAAHDGALSWLTPGDAA